MWKKQLVELLFSDNPSKINAKKAISLKYKNTPDSLFRYRTIDNEGYALNMLKTDKIWLSTPDKFNDPFDCALKLTPKDMDNEYALKVLESNLSVFKHQFNFSDKELDRLMKSKHVIYDMALLHLKKKYSNSKKPDELKKIAAKMEKNIKNSDLGMTNRFKDKIYISCFSETNKSILMWSHYAENHEGFCVEYDFKELGANDPVTRYIFPVIYSNKVFDLGNYYSHSNKEFDDVAANYMHGININDIVEGLTLPKRNKRYNNMAIVYAALNKSIDWIYEKEWRYVLPYNNQTLKPLCISVPKPQAIYLGAKISKENTEKLIAICKTRDIKIYKMNINPFEFVLESTLIE